jgi:hypothetical protein
VGPRPRGAHRPGHGQALSFEFTEFALSVRPTETVLGGEVRDQSELHWVLEMIQSLGLELVELRNLEQTKAP